MKKNFILRIFIIVIIFFFLFIIFFKDKNEKPTINDQDTKNIEEDIENSNIIKDVSYISKDSRGNEYKLEAAEGVIV